MQRSFVDIVVNV